ncbi:MAG TPA: hypothetical protein VJU80_11405 [Solirubrobacteraceae bacterium]|nr:hypothetical protein [Solirubrobacteraceae bacterium]
MSPRIAAATVLAILAAAGPTASASADPATSDALLKGSFQMSGRVTVAHNVRGERVGQLVTRAWTFSPACAAAPCATVQLVRARSGATDTLTLEQTRSGSYAGSGLFYAPLRCSGRIYPQGQEIPFRITVRITATNGTTASAISATYVNRKRKNLTPCIGVLGHDSARYVGLLTPG